MGKQPFGFSFDPSQAMTQNMELSPTKEPKNESGNETDNTDDLLFDDREESDEGDEDDFEESFLSKWKRDSLSAPKDEEETTEPKLNGSGAFDEPMTETQILMMTQPEHMSLTPPAVVNTAEVATESETGLKTELICEEIIETVITKRKCYYIRLVLTTVLFFNKEKSCQID